MATQEMRLPTGDDSRNVLRNVENLFNQALVERVFEDGAISGDKVSGSIAQLAQDPPVDAGSVPTVLTTTYDGNPSTTTIDLSAYGSGKLGIVYYTFLEAFGVAGCNVDFSPTGLGLLLRIIVDASGHEEGFAIVPLVNNQFDVSLSGASAFTTILVAFIGIL